MCLCTCVCMYVHMHAYTNGQMQQWTENNLRELVLSFVLCIPEITLMGFGSLFHYLLNYSHQLGSKLKVRAKTLFPCSSVLLPISHTNGAHLAGKTV